MTRLCRKERNPELQLGEYSFSTDIKPTDIQNVINKGKDKKYCSVECFKEHKGGETVSVSALIYEAMALNASLPAPTFGVQSLAAVAEICIV